MERLEDTITIPEINMKVFIRTEHFPDASEGDHYETVGVSQENNKHWWYRRKYKTEDEAKQGHQKLVVKLKTPKWVLIPIEWKLKYVDE